MAENKVIIDVEVQGVQQAQKDLNRVEASAEDIGESVKGVGESFKGVGAIVSAQGGVMGEAFNALGDSVGGIVDGITSMAGVMQAGGQSGAINGSLTVMCGADSETVFADVIRLDTNNVRFLFRTAPAAAAYRCVITRI